MKMLIVSGKTIEDAIQNGLAQWNVTLDRVVVHVLEKPTRGLFGLIGVRPAKVELELCADDPASLRDEAEVDSVGNLLLRAERSSDVIVATAPNDYDPIEEGVQFITDVAQSIGIEVRIRVYKSRKNVIFDICGSGLGLVIGRRGQTLDALQYLTNLVVNRNTKRHLRIILDAEQFRARRKKTLESLATRLAGQVVSTGQQILLEPMTAQERKIIHAQLHNHRKVATFSQGEEPHRCVIIRLKI